MKNNRYNQILTLAKEFNFQPYSFKKEMSFPCLAIVIHIEDDLTEKQINNRFKTKDYQSIVCRSIYELDNCFNVFNHMTYDEDFSLFLITNFIEKTKIEQPYFIKNMIAPMQHKVDQTFTADEAFPIFLQRIKHHDLNDKNYNDALAHFISEYRIAVLHAFNSQFYADDSLQMNDWFLGNGFALPFTIDQIEHVFHKESKKKVTLFEAAAYANIVVLQRYLLPSFDHDQLDNVMIKNLIDFIQWHLDYNYLYTGMTFKLGNVQDFKLVDQGYHFIMDIEAVDNEWIDEMLTEVDQSYFIAQIDANKQNVLSETITKVYEGYNNGHYKDVMKLFKTTQQHSPYQNLTLLCKFE